MTQPAPAIGEVLDQLPDAPRARLMQMRGLILAAATATQTAPLTETLKWGQPAFLPARKDGTTIRLGWSEKMPETCAFLVHCQTDLLSRYRQLFPTEFTYDGNRAVLVPTEGPFPEAALQQMAAMALTYHRDKRAAR